MMARTFFILVALFSVSFPFLARAGDKGGEPEAYLPETVYEFRPIVEGSEVSHEFVLHNRGSAELSVLKLKSG